MLELRLAAIATSDDPTHVVSSYHVISHYRFDFFFSFLFFSSVYPVTPVFFFLTLSVVAAVGNALVILAAWKDHFKQLKRNLANYLIINLAISDLLAAIAAFPLRILLNWFPDETVNRAAFSIGHLASNVSHLTILSIAVERLTVISYPFWSADYLTSSYLIPRIIMLIWFLAGLSALVPIIRFDLYWNYLTFIVDDVFRTSIIILILTCYTRIYFLFRASLYRDITTSEERQPEGQRLTKSARTIEKLRRKERSVACTVFILVVTHVGCWIPKIVLRNLDASCNAHPQNVNYFFEDVFVSLHTLLNPLAYSLCTKKFRRTLWRLCQTCKLFSLIKTMRWRIFLLIIILIYSFIIWRNFDF